MTVSAHSRSQGCGCQERRRALAELEPDVAVEWDTRDAIKLTGGQFLLSDASLLGGAGGPSAAGGTLVPPGCGFLLKPWNERSRTQMQILPEVQAKLESISGLQIFGFNLPSLPGTGEGLPFQFVINTAKGLSSVEAIPLFDSGKSCVRTSAPDSTAPDPGACALLFCQER